MLLVAGGQLDPNIGALLRRCLARKVDFRDLLVGPGLTPELHIDLSGRFSLDGHEIRPTACFLRHDVFLAQCTGAPEDHRGALNWYHAVRDWALSRNVRILNRHGRSGDHGKYGILLKAQTLGLSVPPTTLTNAAPRISGPSHVRKPAAGGELTTLVEADGETWPHPYFVQPRLHRPELRVYRIGGSLRGFELASTDLDYRANHQVEIAPATVPDDLSIGLLALCNDLGLDFAAADFMQDAKGRWVFLEVNSQPMFAAFDTTLGGDLSDLLLDWLLETARPIQRAGLAI